MTLSEGNLNKQEERTFDMRVAVVLGVKDDGKYLQEYVTHYISIGVDKIIMFDNNEPDGEQPLDFLKGLEQHIILIDKRGNRSKSRQWGYYSEALIKFKHQFDWMMFFDDDEFLFLNKHKSIKSWLSMPVFKDVDVIHVNWKMMSDSNQLYYEDKPVTERFPIPTPDVQMFFPHNKWKVNNHVKSIVRCTNKPIFFSHPHICYTTIQELIAVNSSGRRVDPNSPFCDTDYTYAELRHYQFKSTEEFCQRRVGTERQTNNQRFDGSYSNPSWEIEYYFRYNQRTPEKEEVIAKYCKDNCIKI